MTTPLSLALILYACILPCGYSRMFRKISEGSQSVSQHSESSCRISCPEHGLSQPAPPSPTADFLFILAVAATTAAGARRSVQLR